MTDTTTPDRLRVALTAAEAGAAVLKEWAGRITAREKGRFDLVTEADVASQDAIQSVLESACPNDGLLGEEGLSREPTGNSDVRWIIDPLDGTQNYVHQFPYYAVSIGAADADGLLLGVVADPTRDEVFSAIRGAGAYLNGERLRVTDVDDVSRAMTMASLPVGAGVEHRAVQRFLQALKVVQVVQRSGSAALNLCNLAAGRLDGFWSESLKPWDMAAGVLIAREAGARVTRIDGGSFDVMTPDMLATNGTPLHDALITVLVDQSDA